AYLSSSSLLFVNATATPEIYSLSLHDALPILIRIDIPGPPNTEGDGYDWVEVEHEEITSTPDRDEYAFRVRPTQSPLSAGDETRSEEHTSELQSRENLVCRLLLEKKKK